jgi:hypothetical protein
VDVNAVCKRLVHIDSVFLSHNHENRISESIELIVDVYGHVIFSDKLQLVVMCKYFNPHVKETRVKGLLKFILQTEK